MRRAELRRGYRGGVIALLLGLALLGVFVVLVVREPRRLVNGVVLLAERGISTRMLLVTSNFHALRTVILARRMGLDAAVVGSPTALYYLPSAVVREFVGILFEHKWFYLTVCVALAAAPPLLVLILAAIPGEQ
ncbi:YdcF family protein [Nocardia otitidiscaviarum]|nr:YdcF family protein [Nocardia otitidiscaviarum]